MDNKYVKHAKISEAKFRQLARLFAMDLTATQIAELANLNRNTVNKYMKGIRGRIAEYSSMLTPPELPKAETGRPEGRSIHLLGILEKGGTIYTRALEAEPSRKLRKAITGGHAATEWVRSKPFSGFNLLLVPGSFDRLRIPAGETGTENIQAKYNRIEGFLGYTRGRLEKFKGMHDSTFYLHFKECEFRYNHPSDSIYPLILKIIRNNPLF